MSNTLDTPDQRKSELRGDTKTTDTMTDVSENNEGVNVSPRNNFSSQLMEIIDYHFSRYVEDDFKPDQKVQVNNIIELYHSLLKFANDPDVFICPINKYFRPCGYRVEKEKLI